VQGFLQQEEAYINASPLTYFYFYYYSPNNTQRNFNTFGFQHPKPNQVSLSLNTLFSFFIYLLLNFIHFSHLKSLELIFISRLYF